jgi:hypothetical protein
MSVMQLRAFARLFVGVPVMMGVLVACDEDYGSGPDDTPLPQGNVLTATGDVSAKVAEFRALLGDPANGGTAGEQVTGRREIGWDGAGANPFNNRNDFPADFFNNQTKAGAVFATDGTGFRNDSTLFAGVDPSYADQFNFFSANRIFSPIGSPRMDVLFRVAGEATAAAVTGFGVVFVDVDKSGVASIEPYDASGRSLGVFAAPVRSDANGLSFVGVKFDTAIIARVRIRSGESAIAVGVKDASAGGAADLVVMDNFLYGEPHKQQ